jgi:hypothetical protein
VCAAEGNGKGDPKSFALCESEYVFFDPALGTVLTKDAYKPDGR